jgi:cellobiose-specific phosphotransferase system component IIB
MVKLVLICNASKSSRLLQNYLKHSNSDMRDAEIWKDDILQPQIKMADLFAITYPSSCYNCL